MSKILKIELQNFQSHKNSIIELHKGLNVITGPSDSGKSAIIRAIRWVLYNEPRGSDFITTSTNQCKVSLYFDNGAIITRERTPTKNRYILQTNEKKEIYEGFGNTVPSEIIESHQIRNLYLDTDQKNTINLATQLEGPFLLSQSGAIRAKAIGRILGIHYLDSASRKASSTIGELRKDYTQQLEAQKRIKDKLKDYEIYAQYQMILDKANSNYLKLENSYERLESLKKLNKKVQGMKEDILKTKEIVAKTNGINILENNLKTMSSLMTQKQKLSQLNLKTIQMSKEVNLVLKIIITTENHLELEERIKSLNYIKEILLNYKRLSNQYNSHLLDFNKFNKLLQQTCDIELWESNLSQLLALHIKLQELNKIVIRFNSLTKQRDSTLTILRGIANYNIIDSNSSKLVLLSEKLKKLEEANKKISEIKLRIKKGREFLIDNTIKLNQLLKHYQDILAKVGECPICESRIDEDKSKKLINKWR